MTFPIDEFTPRTGRVIKEDGTTVNVGDLLELIGAGDVTVVLSVVKQGAKDATAESWTVVDDNSADILTALQAIQTAAEAIQTAAEAIQAVLEDVHGSGVLNVASA